MIKILFYYSIRKKEVCLNGIHFIGLLLIRVFSIYQGRQWGILYQSSWPPRWRYRSPCTAPWNQPQPLFPNWSSEMSLPCLFSDSPDRLSNRSISRSANRINVLYVTFYTREKLSPETDFNGLTERIHD